VADPSLLLVGVRVPISCFKFFNVFFGMGRQRHLENKATYPCSGGAPSIGGRHVELFIRRISWDPDGFNVQWCDFRFSSFDLCLLSLAMIVSLMRWLFGKQYDYSYV
jgi:hypothetical protein